MIMANKPPSISILAVDDNLNTLEILNRILSGVGYQMRTCDSVMAAVEILENQPVDLVITDLKMPRHNGQELVRYVSENHSKTNVIVITGYPSIDGAVAAVKQGAEEFLAKPFTNEELLTAVEKVLERRARIGMSRSQASIEYAYGIVGSSESMQRVYRLIAKAATMSANVLISGESGTGKELVARAIHYSSLRSDAPFVPVNCTAIPDTLLESELFGHVKGAFTGANASRTGFFQIAVGGTIFLDEIGDASQSLQAKLLRVLQHKEITRVGSGEVIKIDTRVIAATNRDLKILIDKHQFREDLFYRLSILDIFIPPLRSRREDIPELIDHFCRNYCREIDREPLGFSDRAIEALTNYTWPGNVRELENMIQKLIVIVDKPIIDISDLPEQMRFRIEQDHGPLRSLEQVEAEYIAHVLAIVAGNKTRAAEILQIDRKTLREKLKKNSSDS